MAHLAGELKNLQKNNKVLFRQFLDITAVVPAYNEAPRIARSISYLLKLGIKVIVVNDGSVDNTKEVVLEMQKQKEYSALLELVNLHKNSGKARAMYEGLKRVKTEYVLFWDGDIVSVSEEKFKDCLSRYCKLANKGKIMITFTTRHFFLDKLTNKAITGLRLLPTALAMDIFERFFKAHTYGFLIEVFISQYFFRNKLNVFDCVIDFTHVMKYKKYGWQGWIHDIKMSARLIFSRYAPYIIKAQVAIKTLNNRA